ncbi:head morphogenesis protein [Rhodoferax sp. U2-2l]|uniref:phage head morphogenesis protein n=1 Tax=Rhodoferax sp. U2-2l TaxID=2884000 RepID=UPI001D0A5475|nr:phage minor head protein [Rhodoferax sp. U2-2l]MCB8748366.1 head morphogenesis protein [Rhodoferax sp. U2-2l]
MSTAVADQAFGFGTPFQAQIDYLVQKLRLPTDRWDDIMRSAHDRAFIVAGAAKADLLADLHQAVVKSAADGAGLQAFRKDFKAIVAKHGWTGWTGEGTREGEAWRTRIIYQTNMATSYSAGRYQQMTDPEVLKLHPYWRYIHSDGVLNPRQQHLAWHGLTLRHDHPFWKSHWAPNGFGCHCRITSVTRREGEASARAGLGEPPAGWDAIDPATGEPVGIGKGFGYAPGANVNVPLRQMVQDKLISYPPAIAKAMAADIGRYINTTEAATAFAQRMLVDRSVTEPLFVGFVEAVDAVSAAAGSDVLGYFVTIPGDAPRHAESSHSHDGKGQRLAKPSDYERVRSVLNEADSTRAGDVSRNGNATVVASKKFGGETYRAVFEVLPGKKNRALALLSLIIKTPK